MKLLTEAQIDRFKKLAQLDEDQSKKVVDHLIEESKKGKKGKEKKDCVKGNKRHDSEGKFAKSGTGSS